MKGFWKGLSASYWGCSEGCIQFVVYEKLKKQLVERCVQSIRLRVGSTGTIGREDDSHGRHHLIHALTLLSTTNSNNEKRRARGLAESEELPPAYTLGAAAFSKFLATTATYPHEVVRTRYALSCDLPCFA